MFFPQSASKGLCIQYSTVYRTSSGLGRKCCHAEGERVYEPQHNTDLMSSPAVWCLCQLLCQYSSELIRALLNPSVRKISSHDQSSHVYNIYSNVLLQYHDWWAGAVWIITMTSALPACNSLLLVIYQTFHIQSLLRATYVILIVGIIPLKQSRV